MYILSPNTVQPALCREGQMDRRLLGSVDLVEEIYELLEVDFVT